MNLFKLCFSRLLFALLALFVLLDLNVYAQSPSPIIDLPIEDSDEALGYFEDISGNNFHGILVNNPGLAYDPIRKQTVLDLGFEGQDDYLRFSPLALNDLDEEITISAWVKGLPNQIQHLLSAQRGYQSELPEDIYIVQKGVKDRGVEFIDLNADGLTDIVFALRYTSPTKTFYFRSSYINTGINFEKRAEWTLPHPQGHDPIVLADNKDERFRQATRFIDLDGDGLLDLVHAFFKDASSRAHTYRNTGNGWEAMPESYQFPEWLLQKQIVVKDRGTRFVELNGDGLPDLVFSLRWAGIDYRKAWINTGSSWEEKEEYIPPVPIGQQYLQDKGVVFLDLDGDGDDDILAGYKWADDPDELFAYLNNGNGWDLDTDYTPPFPLSRDLFGTNGVSFGDLNGDGLPDLLQSRFLNGIEYKSTYLNTGSGFNPAPGLELDFHLYNGIHGDMGGKLVDLNGDGALEAIQYLSWGGIAYNSAYEQIDNTWQAAPQWQSPNTQQGFIPFVQQGVTSRGSQLVDLNNDGLLDLVVSFDWGKESNINQRQKESYLNNGNGWDHAPNYELPVFLSSHATPTSIYNIPDYGVRFVDVTGDGLPECLYASYWAGSITKNIWLNTENSQGVGTAWETATGAGSGIDIRIPNQINQIVWNAGYSPAGFDGISKTATDAELYDGWRGPWHHLVFTKNAHSGLMKIYLDGELWHQEGNKARLLTGLSALRLGKAFDSISRYNGLVDQIKIYDKELTAQQAAELFNAERNPDVDEDGIDDLLEKEAIFSDLNDGIESIYDLDPNEDFDQDGFSNIEEVQSGNSLAYSDRPKSVIELVADGNLYNHSIELSWSLPEDDIEQLDVYRILNEGSAELLERVDSKS